MTKKRLAIILLTFLLLISLVLVVSSTLFLDFNKNFKNKFIAKEYFSEISNLESEDEFTVDQETNITARLQIPYLEENGWKFEDAPNFIDAKAKVNKELVSINVNGNKGELSREEFAKNFYFMDGNFWQTHQISKSNISKEDGILIYYVYDNHFKSKYVQSLVDFFVGSLKSQGILKSNSEFELLNEPNYILKIQFIDEEMIINEYLDNELRLELDFSGPSLDQDLITKSESTIGTLVLKDSLTRTSVSLTQNEIRESSSDVELFWQYLKGN